MLQGGVGGEDGVVGLDDGGGDLWGGVDGELQLGLLAGNRETIHQKGGKTVCSFSRDQKLQQVTKNGFKMALF